jgi:transposase
MLVDRLLNDGCDAAIKTFGASNMTSGQEMRDGIAVHPNLPQQRPDAAWRHAERFAHSGDIGRCPGSIGQAHNQVAPPCRRSPTGIVVARLVCDACHRASHLAKLHRAGELTAVWVPDQAHEAIRDLVRARQAAVRTLRQARQQLSGFLLRHGYHYHRPAWTQLHRRWLASLKFEHPVHHIVLEDCIATVEAATARCDRLETHIEAALPEWSLASVVQALQALRGVGLVAAATLVAELGDITRFTNPRQLMAYLGLVPSEHSSGGTRRQGGITKAGNGAARRMLIEAAWSYRFPARISREQLLRQERLAKPIRDIAWKAQERLCRRYRKLARAGKLPTVITVAVARELAGFIWAIAKQAQLTAP